MKQSLEARDNPLNKRASTEPTTSAVVSIALAVAEPFRGYTLSSHCTWCPKLPPSLHVQRHGNILTDIEALEAQPTKLARKPQVLECCSFISTTSSRINNRTSYHKNDRSTGISAQDAVLKLLDSSHEICNSPIHRWVELSI